MATLVGHRGAPALRTENTIPSLRLAGDLGADAVEFDVRSSSDGVPILLHDRTLERFWGVPRTPGELTLDELRRLRTDDPDERIPTLAEVAETVPIQLVVDNKEPGLVPAVTAALETACALDRTLFIGEWQVLTVVREHLPAAEIVLSWVGPDLPPEELLRSVRPQALNLRFDSLTEQSVRHAADLGYRMWTYCVDDQAAAERALDWDVDGFISNDLVAVRPVLTNVNGS